jgi:SRSO17 transposase
MDRVEIALSRPRANEVGLDEYEVRKWEAWHRHVALSLLARAYLAVLRSDAHDAREPEAKRGSVATSS